MISLSALAIFPMPYLRSFAFAGVAVVALARGRVGRGAPGGARGARSTGREGPHLQAQAGRAALLAGPGARVMSHPVPYAVGRA